MESWSLFGIFAKRVLAAVLKASAKTHKKKYETQIKENLPNGFWRGF